MIRWLPLLLSALLAACGPGPDPCGTLCDDAGFSQVDELGREDGSLVCACSQPGGFGSLLLEEDCAGYCAEVGAGEATLESTESDDDTCVCADS